MPVGAKKSEQRKKKVILWLLILSCIISGVILINTTSPDDSRIRELAEVDSLIVSELKQFNILSDQISVHSIAIDSLFTRKVYEVSVPRDFSKTHLHYSLNRELLPYEINTPARVQFPEQDLNIHLLLNETVFRTLRLQTDTAAVTRKLSAHIFFRFEELPSQELIDEIIRLGEPTPLVLAVASPLQADEWQQQVSKLYTRISYELRPDEATGTDPWSDPAVIVKRLEQLNNVDRNARVLLYRNAIDPLAPATKRKLSTTGVRFFDVSDAEIIDGSGGRRQFEQQMNQLMRRAAAGESPVAVINGDERTLRWLHELLPQMRKRGLYITVPRSQQRIG